MGYVSLCAWREARGEPEEGISGVIYVIRNRTVMWYSNIVDPWHYAIYLKWQFTSMSDPYDPEYQLFPDPSDPIWQFCEARAKAIVDGEDNSPVGRSLYYANLQHIDANGWFARNIIANPVEHPTMAVIGNHTFYA